MKKSSKRYFPFLLWRSKYVRRFSISVLISLILIGRSMIVPAIAAVSTSFPQVTETRGENPTQMLVFEVDVRSNAEDLTEHLVAKVYRAISIKTGETAASAQIEESVNSIFDTGYFSEVSKSIEIVPGGINVTFIVTPNPNLRRVYIEGNTLDSILYKNQYISVQEAVDLIFRNQYNKPLNSLLFQQGKSEVERLYVDEGYVLSKIISSSEISSEGTISIDISEGIIGDFQFQFQTRTKENKDGDEQERIVQSTGVTPENEISSQIYSEKGQIFNEKAIKSDIQRIADLGISEGLKIDLGPMPDNPRRVLITIFIINETVSKWHPWSRDALKALSAVRKKDFETAISSYKELVKKIKNENPSDSESLIAFARNSIGNLYKKLENYRLASEYYQQAASDFEELQSPVFLMSTLINLALTYTALENPSKAVSTYQTALTLTRETQHSIRSEKRLDPLLSNYLLDSPEKDVDYILGLLNLIEVVLTFDISTHYSSLGDHQQALYLVSNSELLSNIEQSESLWNGIANNFLESDNLVGIEQGFADFIPVVGKVISGFPEIIQPLALRFIYRDFGDERRASLYDRQSLQAIQKSLEIIGSSLITINWGESSYEDLIFESIGFLLKNNKSVEDVEVLSKKLTKAAKDLFEGDVNRWGDFIESGVKLSISTVAGIEEDQQTIDFFQKVLASSQEISVPDVELDLEEEFLWVQPLLSNMTQDILKLMEGFLLKAQGSIYSSMGKDRDAISLYLETSQVVQKDRAEVEQSLNKLEQNIPSLFEAFLWGVQSIPSVLFSQGQQTLLDNPDAFANEAISLFEAILGPIRDNPDKAQKLLESIQSTIIILSANVQVDALTSLADRYIALDQLDKARSVYLQALELSFLYENSLKDAQIRYGLSRIEFSLGNFIAAEQVMKPALQILENNPPAAPKQFKGQFSQANFDYGYDAQDSGFGLSMGFSSKGIFERISSGRMISVFGETCTSVPEYFSCKQSYFEQYINSLWELEKQNPQGRYAQLSFEASERYRSGIPELLSLVRGQQLELSADVRQQGSEIVGFRSRSPGQTPPDYDFFQNVLLLNQPKKYSEIRGQLDSRTLLLEYFLGRERSYLWIASSDNDIKIYPLSSREIIQRKGKEYYDMLTIPENRKRPRKTAEVGMELSHLLLEPIIPQLVQTNKRIVIVADGILQYVPFSALPNPGLLTDSDSSNRGFAKYMHPLMLDHEIVNLPSASVLPGIRLRHQDRQPASKEIAIFANPVFNHEDPRAKKLLNNFSDRRSNSVSIFRRKIPSDITIVHSSLPGTQTEAEQIISSVDTDQSRQYVKHEGFDARYDMALSDSLNDYRIVHFATHGTFNTRSPERSGIVLSSFGEDGELQRGLLSPADAFRMSLGSNELVVLSGCRTGWSDEVRREALSGLTGSFISAGSERVLVSLWSVQDKATAELMSRFYREMLDQHHPLSASQAITKVQRSMWEEPQWQSPYYWAAFSLQGEWN